jgi:hypothetical protein
MLFQYFWKADNRRYVRLGAKRSPLATSALRADYCGTVKQALYIRTCRFHLRAEIPASTCLTKPIVAKNCMASV